MNRNPLLKKKVFLYLTEFLCGIGVMGVETAASRLLAPYFSSSQVVYTLIIGMILIAMSLGNYLGGKMADKHPDVTHLYVLLIISGTYICLVPFVGRYVIALVSALYALFVTSGLIIWASLTVCLILFVPPLLILGMVTPSLVKYAMGEKASGKVVGTLEALNTLGSILGTFLPTFVTIPTVGTSNSFAIFGGLIALIALVYLFTGIFYDVWSKKHPKDKEKSSPKRSKLLKRGILTFACSCLAGYGVFLCTRSHFVFWKDDSIVYEDESIYNYLQVNETERSLYFSTNVLFGVQSMMNKDGSLTGMYYDYCLAAPYMANVQEKKDVKMLILGNAMGTYASLTKKYIPYESEIDAVEIDPKINELAKTKFSLPEDVHLYTDDGRNFLNQRKGTYDVIMVDAYSSISVPFQMASVEFFKEVKEHLTEDGVMVMNINMSGNGENEIDQALSDTVHDSFSQVYKFHIPGGTNDELFASNNPNMMENLSVALPSLQGSDLYSPLHSVYRNTPPHQDTGIRLRDDDADVELRAMNSVDDIIMGELAEYRKVYQERGLKGLLDYLLG